MKRIITLATTFLLIAGVASVSASNLTEAYFSGKNPQLTQQEREAIAMAKKWQANSAQGIKPVAGSDGSIRFLCCRWHVVLRRPRCQTALRTVVAPAR